MLACYATAVALNDFLPANLGTLVMLVSLIASATFAAVLSGLVVEKIPFSILNVAPYLYLFGTVSGSFSIKLGWDVVFAVALVCWAFGWSGGRELVRSSYGEAKVRSQELKRRRRPTGAAEAPEP